MNCKRSIHETGRRARISVVVLLALVLAACGGGNGDNGTDGRSALVLTSALPVGDIQCGTGGFQLDSGLDLDANGRLDASEITNTQYVCNGLSGSSGQNTLIAIVDEPAGANCPNGGHKISAGLDRDGNGLLDASEATTTGYVCNGARGGTGASGASGANSLVSIQAEPAGSNCAYGGSRITSGVDVNGNSVLDPAEVAATSYSCNGAPGPAGAPGTSPGFIGTQFQSIQFLPGTTLVVLSCDSTSQGTNANGDFHTCNGPRINGLQIEADGDVMDQSRAVEVICGAINATRITSWNRSQNLSRPYISWDGTSWVGGSDASFTNSYSRITCTV